MREAPYGSWSSPITAADLTVATVGLSGGVVSDGVRYWTQAHPEQGGRVTLWREDDAGREEVTPDAYLRTAVNEYGGGEWAVAGGIVVLSSWPDGSVQAIEPGQPARRIAPGGEFRYAALHLDPIRRVVLAVREDHSVTPEPRTTIVALDLDSANPGGGRVLVSGADFYAHPVLSRDGQLAWVEWNHPDMPWDSTYLKVARLPEFVEPPTCEPAATRASTPAEAPANGPTRSPAVVPDDDQTAALGTVQTPDGRSATPAVVGGGPGISAVYPAWSPDGSLLFLADPDGFWNFHRWDGARTEVVYQAPADFCGPMWVLTPAPYAVIDDRRIGCSVSVHGYASLAVIHHAGGEPAHLELVESEAVTATVTGSGSRALALLGYPDRPAALVEVDWDSGALTTVKASSEQVPDPALVARAEAVSWQGPLGEVHAWYYPPANPDFTAPAGELPPVQVWSHGGPTGFSGPEYRLATQYWTSRGIGIVDVNYGGSTGYGRAYRERLRGNWGVVDVRDCCDAALTLVARGLADPARLSIRGGSAGGYTTLAALAFTEVFSAGISLYGIGDLETLATDTHKFESRYLDGLVAPYPEGRQTYLERSPLHHLDRLSCPMLILQGGQDRVVPPSQAEQMVAALRAKGLPVAYVFYPDEGHGFRRAENVIATAQAALAFLGSVHGFAPADDLPELDLR
jgi:dienelactone hydrolase